MTTRWRPDFQQHTFTVNNSGKPRSRSTALVRLVLCGTLVWLCCQVHNGNRNGGGRVPRADSATVLAAAVPLERSAPVTVSESAARAAGWTSLTKNARTARVEIFHDSTRKYPLTRREIFTTAGADGKQIELAGEMVADHVILHAKNGADRAALEAVLPSGYRVRACLHLKDHFLISFDGGGSATLSRALTELSALGQVEPDGYMQDAALPNDPMLSEQWAFGADPGGIVPGPAWDRATGSPSVLVAVIDTGVDYNHPDLAANISLNPGESGNGRESNGVDDDANGFVDDVRGWDFAAAGAGDNDPMDDREDSGGKIIGHGTHVAGIIGAVGNNGSGISGVAWQVSILPVKALDRFGRGTWSDMTQALAYAVSRGAPVSNNAYGTWVAPSSAIKTAVALARDAGMLFIASAGNGDYPANGSSTGDDLDRHPYYPACLDVANILSVAAHGRNGALASFSNFGRAGADLTAPGMDISSTFSGGGYGRLSGTSMSSAFVSGAAAVALSLRPDLDRIGLLTVLNSQVDRGDPYRDRLRWAGRLNLDQAVRTAARPMVEQRIAAGANHFLHVRPDGTVAGWGRAGAIGLGTTAVDATILPTPTTLPPFQDAIGVGAAGLAGYVLTRSGEVWVAGLVQFNTAAPVLSHPTFALLGTIPGAVGMAASGGSGPGHHENIAVVDAAGTVFMLGSNTFRQLGPGVGAPTGFSETFNAVTGLPPVVAIDIYEGTVVALDSAGTLWSWGRMAGSSATPAVVPGNRPPLSAVATRYPVLTRLAALESGGRAAFIDPLNGATEHLVIPAPSRFVFAMGVHRAVERTGFGLVRADGGLFTGEGDLIDEVVAAAYNGATGVIVRSDGTSFTWGSKVGGLRGIGMYEFRSRPSPFHSLPNTVRAWSGSQGLTVLGVDGQLRGVSYNDSFTPPGSVPRLPLNVAALTPPGATLEDVTAGAFHWLLVFSNGTVLGAGENFTGALGALPPSVTGFQSVGFPTTAVAAAAGYNYSLALDDLGGVWAAGDNFYGQLGEAGNPGGGVWRRIPSLFNITKIATDGFIRSFAMNASGALWTWGNDQFFVPVSMPAGAAAVDFAVVPATAEGPVSHRLAVATSDGRVLLFPSFAGLPASLPSPLSLALPNVSRISLGTRHGLALTATGRVFAWGENTAGQLGTGTFESPGAGVVARSVAVPGLASVAAHGRSSFAAATNGRLWRWGEDVDLRNLLGDDIPSQTLAVGLSNVIFDSGNTGTDWWTRYFSLDELEDDMLSGNEADPDSDSLSNLLEYALDTNPRETGDVANWLDFDLEEIPEGGAGSGAVSAASLEPGQLHAKLTLTRGAKRSDIDYLFEYSDDLEIWYRDPDNFFVAVDTESTLIAYDQEPFSSTSRRFYRLTVGFRSR